LSLEPGAHINRGEPVKPRQAATVIVLRGGAETLEVLLVKRNPEQRFMGGAWVFPGGAVELPDPAALVRFSRWITPEAVSIRFDTHFFLVAAPEDADPQPDGGETVDLGWFTPRGAIDAYKRDEILLVFPTIKTLEQLAEFSSADRLLEWASGRDVEPVEPQVIGEGPAARIVLPGEPGYHA
jgi:8-oxo-dGTP pyrophosphatase MutT (NUDIX family)